MHEPAHNRSISNPLATGRPKVDFGLAFDLCPEAYAILDEDRQIVHANRAFCRLADRNLTGLQALYFLKLIHSEDRDRVLEILEQAAERSTPVSFLSRFSVNKDSYRVIHWSCQVDGASSLVYLLGSESNKRDGLVGMMENHVEGVEYALRRAQEVAGIGNFVLDLVHPANNEWSEQTLKILGLPGKTSRLSHVDVLRNVVHENDRRKVYEAFVSSIEHGGPVQEEFRLIHVNGTIHHVLCNAEPICESDGKVVRHIGTLLDITARKHIEHELRNSHNLTAAILDTTVDGIITINEDGCIHTFNKAAERLFGYSADEVIGENVSMLMPSPYREQHDGYIQSYLRTGRARIIGIGREVTGLRKDGTTFPMELAVSETRDKGRIFTGIVRDITARREMQREILHVGEFERQRIGQELHDGLGSQLTGIGMICQSLARQMEKRGAPCATDLHEIAEQIKEADYQARNLARVLVPVAAEPNGLLTALNKLKTYVESSGIECQVAVEADLHIEDSTVATHLYRIAQEAVANAIKHSEASRITIEMLGLNDAGDIRLAVTDDGIGMDEHDGEAAGIGMRTMRYRAGMLGASLAWQSKKGIGTTIECKMNSRELNAFKSFS